MPQSKSCSALLLFHILKDPDTKDCLKQLMLQLTFGDICGKKQKSSWLIHCGFSCSVGDLILEVIAACRSCDLWLWFLTFSNADEFPRVPLAVPAPPAVTFHCHRRDRPLFIRSHLGTSCSNSMQLCCWEHRQADPWLGLSLTGGKPGGQPARGALLSGAACLNPGDFRRQGVSDGNCWKIMWYLQCHMDVSMAHD